MAPIRRAVFDTNILISAYLWPGTPRQALEIVRSGRCVLVSADADNLFLSIALEGGCTVIVSGDHHLLDLRRYQQVRIVSAAAFVRALQPD